MNPVKKNLANAVTCCNVLCGTLSIFVLLGPDVVLGLPSWQVACLLIFLAAVADFADGLVARAVGVSGPLGRELDSLSDLVSFCVAPAVLLRVALLGAGTQEWVAWLPALIPVAGAVRLAKFNIDTRQTTSFLGMPVPANAIFWIGYAAAVYGGWGALASPWLVTIGVVTLCLLMISELPLLALKFKNYSWKGNEARYLLVMGVCALILLFPGAPGLMLIIAWYVVISIIARLKSGRGATKNGKR
ncbi:MAG: CDP-diacylglycerol--serine O-phosphatidyltransferase [Muribaculaceae bacterium]|nr:CDP-diacylglycerol--serine O-phosphatidyltransferase [Muribaculaceae bacterium]